MTSPAARLIRQRVPLRGLELYGETEDPAAGALHRLDVYRRLHASILRRIAAPSDRDLLHVADLVVMARRVAEMVADKSAEALRLSRTRVVRT